MEKRKFKQSIMIVAILLGLWWYYSTQWSAKRLKSAEQETNVVPSCVIKTVQQAEVSPESF